MDSKVCIRIKEVRIKLKMTQKDFALELGVTQANISAIESGTYNASMTLIKLICIKYKISEKWLLEGDGNMYYFPSDWNVKNLEGLLKKYEAMKILFEDHIDSHSSDYPVEFSIIQSFSSFVSLTSTSKLSKQNAITYVEQIDTLLDELEKYVFQCSTLNKRAKTNYARLYELVVNKEKIKKIVCRCVDKITETFLVNACIDCCNFDTDQS